jgi:hypothetical protein
MVSMAWSALPSWIFAAAWIAAAPATSLLPLHESTRSGRPLVLLLHGRGVQDADSAGLRRQWRDALNMGLVAAGAESLIGEQDLRLVWYADALDPRMSNACERRGDTPTSEIASGLASAGALLGMAAEWLGDAEGAALRSLAGDLLYLGDDAKRCAAEGRLSDALANALRESRPVVLVAHSFGSLVSYHHLRVRDTASAPRVERFVTIGSLLGRPELRALLLGPGGREPALPAGVGSWVNVRDPGDPFASPLIGLGDAGRGGRIQDVRTEKVLPGDPHDAARYLADPATARAVLAAWCGALPGGGSAEGYCRAVTPPPAEESARSNPDRLR